MSKITVIDVIRNDPEFVSRLETALARLPERLQKDLYQFSCWVEAVPSLATGMMADFDPISHRIRVAKYLVDGITVARYPIFALYHEIGHAILFLYGLNNDKNLDAALSFDLPRIPADVRRYFGYADAFHPAADHKQTADLFRGESFASLFAEALIRQHPSQKGARIDPVLGPSNYFPSTYQWVLQLGQKQRYWSNFVSDQTANQQRRRHYPSEGAASHSRVDTFAGGALQCRSYCKRGEDGSVRDIAYLEGIIEEILQSEESISSK